MATCIMHYRSVPSECAMVEVTMIREGREFEDLGYPDKEEGIEKLKGTKGNFILWPYKDIILKIHSSLIVSPQNKEDAGTPTSQNTMCDTTGFTPPSHQNPQKHHSSQTTPPSPQNLPPAQALQHHSPPRVASPKSPPHTTPHSLQNSPPTQPLEYHSLLCPSLKSPPHTTPPQNLLTEQTLQHHFPQHVHSPKSPPHTTPPL
jgi:hypothetical protein